ncbi:ABC-F family ATP-binding cassette domain-containing protein [Candidatus Peregrinibacteria bacterium]|nr:MAG: ABC-F family ATP-binding cassette domain-containing protein [Candidatus Peregrinibacteria bacterium]
MIRLANVSKTFGNKTLFENVNFTVHKHEKIGIIGRNGYGKSTLLRIISGKDVCETGDVLLPKGYRIGELEQHIHFTKSTVLEETQTGLQIATDDKKWKAEMILSGLGFSEADFTRNPQEFSGGYQMRINLAKMLLSEPDMLLLDEPTNYLDIVSLRWLSRFLQKWNGEFLLVTHNRSFMDEVTTHTMAIHRQKIKKMKGGTQQIYRQIFHEEKVYEQTRIATEKKKAKSETFIREFRSGARSAGLVQSRIKMLSKLETQQELEKIPEIAFRFHTKPFHSGNMLSATSLCFGYDAEKPLLIEKLNLTVSPGDKIGIIGKNGAGKTTLLRLLANELSANSGTIKMKSNIEYGYFSQSNTLSLNPQKTILEELIESKEKTTEQEIRDLCASLLFRGNDVHKTISVLSGGEKSRVSLGKILLSSVHLLFLDEPTNHLDMESCNALCNALQEFGGALVFVSHDEDILHRLANKLVVFDSGVRSYELPYSTFLEEIRWKTEEQEIQILKKNTGNGTREDRKEVRKRLQKTEKDIAKLEKGIEKLEAKNEESTKLLQEVSLENDHIRMRQYGEEISELIKKINVSYKELEELLQEKEEMEIFLNDI